ncbi:hypothetical protein BJX63DRAFT_430660 [Aspergillus granulosus]|uniref:Uncharacterized protein n=1 Tax=Aspergillus granulosus TaxID=176169 RepID=A0ABR4HJR3_9EURO
MLPSSRSPDCQTKGFHSGNRINDINYRAENNTITPPAFYDMLASTLFDSLSTLHPVGYKKYLLNLPLLDRAPANQDHEVENRSPSATQVENAAERYQGSEVRVFDAYSALSGILDDLGRYGIVNTNATDACPAYNQPDIVDNYEAYACRFGA